MARYSLRRYLSCKAVIAFPKTRNLGTWKLERVNRRILPHALQIVIGSLGSAEKMTLRARGSTQVGLSALQAVRCSFLASGPQGCAMSRCYQYSAR